MEEQYKKTIIMKKNKNEPKKYTCIVKVANNPDGSAKCLKYRLNDLFKFTYFLDTKHTSWKWFNVYLTKTKEKIKSFTKYNKPIGKDG